MVFTGLIAVVVTFLVLSLLVMFWRLLAALCHTVGWHLSGEAGGLWAKGFRTKGSRYRRTVEVERIISYISLAVRQGYPLPETLRSAADGESRRVATVLIRLAEALEKGLGLTPAIRIVSWNCPDVFLVMIAEGDRSGRLPDALADIEELLADRLFIGPEQKHPGYALAVLTILVTAQIMGGVLFWVIPNFQSIFRDFDVALPVSTLWLIDLSSTLIWVGPILLAVIAVVMLVTAFGTGRTRTGHPKPMARLIGWLRWHLPGLHTIDHGIGMSLAIRQLRVYLMSGRPLAELCDLSRSVSPTNHLSERLRQFTEQVHRGVLPSRAAAEVGLGEVFVAALRAIERGEEPIPALAYAADYYHAIGTRLTDWMRTLAAPMVTLVTAVLVGGIVYSLFIPLVSLIDQITRSIAWA